jgi:hypothetical protein
MSQKVRPLWAAVFPHIFFAVIIENSPNLGFKFVIVKGFFSRKITFNKLNELTYF